MNKNACQGHEARELVLNQELEIVYQPEGAVDHGIDVILEGEDGAKAAYNGMRARLVNTL
jgi:hypothetical protein